MSALLPALFAAALAADETVVVKIQHSGGTELRRGVVVDGEVVIDGDVVAGELSEASGPDAAEALVAQYEAWPRGEVPYDPGGLLADPIWGPRIRDAMRAWEQPTGLRFRLRTDADTGWASFPLPPRNECKAPIGYHVGANVVTLGSGCAERVMHELGHLLGLHHEHQRKGRGASVVVVWDNMSPSRKQAFTEYRNLPDYLLGSPYDYTSVMHYPPTEFGLTAQDDDLNDVELLTLVLPNTKAPNARGFVDPDEARVVLDVIRPSAMPTARDVARVVTIHTMEFARRNAEDVGRTATLDLRTSVDAGPFHGAATFDRLTGLLGDDQLRSLRDAIGRAGDGAALLPDARVVLDHGTAFFERDREVVRADLEAPTPARPARALADADAIDDDTGYAVRSGALVALRGSREITLLPSFRGKILAAEDGRLVWQEPSGMVRAARVEQGELRGIRDLAWLGAGEPIGLVGRTILVVEGGRTLSMEVDLP